MALAELRAQLAGNHAAGSEVATCSQAGTEEAVLSLEGGSAGVATGLESEL